MLTMINERATISPGDRLAAIDIGSNSIRLVVAEYLPHGQFRVLDEERESTRLAKSLSLSGRISDEAMDATIQCLRRFQKIAAGFQVSRLRTIGTAAVREAENGRDLCSRSVGELALDIEVISAYEEAHFAFLSVKKAFDISDRNVAIADIGGGSTELVFASAGYVEGIVPMQLGAVRTTELYGGPEQLFGEDYQRLSTQVDKVLKERVGKPPFVPQVLFGSGGTFTSLASMLMAAAGTSDRPEWGYRARRAEVKHLLERLQAMTIKQRRHIAGLNADRADIIIAGLAIIDRLMRRLKVNVVQVHRGGVRDGLLWSMVQQLQPSEAAREDGNAAISQFAQSCGADWNHSSHVAALAREIFEKLREEFDMDASGARIIEVAAMLQDVGYLINYEQHHKHSYHLILNSHLPGFMRHDIELIANVARYHRGARPKRKHDNFRRLAEADQRRVKQLVSILRVAGGLDRSHSQQVELVGVKITDKRITLSIRSAGDAEVDVWAARKRSDLFQKVFDRELIVVASEERPSRQAAAS